MLIEKFDRSRHNTDNIKKLLSMAVGNPTPEKLAQLLDDFYVADCRTIFIAVDSERIIGIIGIDYTERPHGLITHLAVLPEMRKKGIGSGLFSRTAEILGLSDMEAETDQDAVDFYIACGFSAVEIESRYPKIRRYRCFKNMIEW